MVLAMLLECVRRSVSCAEVLVVKKGARVSGEVKLFNEFKYGHVVGGGWISES